MMILHAGWTVLSAHAEGLLLFVFPAFGLGSLVRGFLKTGSEQPRWMALVENVLLGSLALVWLSFALIVIEQIWPPVMQADRFILLAATAIPLFFAIRNRGIGRLSRSDLLIGGAAFASFFLFLVARFGFLSDLILPPYNDSPKHYKILQGFLHPNAGQLSFYSPISNASHFYHFGFHSLAALLSIGSRLDPATSIAVLGQIFIALTPFSILWIIYAATRSSRAAWVSALFAAFFWQMPYFAVNWGKYPTLAGLILAPAIVGYWIINKRQGGGTWRSYLVLIWLTAGLVLLHTRLAVCLVMAGGVYFLVERVFWERPLRTWEILVLWILSLEAFIPFWDVLRTYYSVANPVGFFVVAALMLFSFQFLPRFSAGISLFVFGTWLASKITIPFAGHHLVLLDQPFVETLLFIPLSLFVGLGIAGLSRQLSDHSVAQLLPAAVLGVVVVLSIPSSFTLTPDSCCNYVRKSDIAAMNWIRQNTKENAVVWISGYKSGNYMIGTDAGVWISGLTTRNANKLQFDFDWDALSARAEICRKGYQEVYIYKGGMPFSFNGAQLARQPWLRIGFQSNGTVIYDFTCAPPGSRPAPAAFRSTLTGPS